MKNHVLILVVMEYGLRLAFAKDEVLYKVLILVVMEYGLRLVCPSASSSRRCLNPCCNGIWSQTENFTGAQHFSLNPCCNGIWSQTGTFVICCAVVL